MNSDIGQKQSYLRANIIDAGYSAEEFVDFLMKDRPDSREISQWAMCELKAKVEQYKKAYPLQQDAVIKNFEIITDQVMYSIAEQDQQRVEYDTSNLYDIAFSTQVNTVPFLFYEKCPVERPIITISNVELKSSGGTFFGIGKYTELWFTIKSNMVEEEIKRSDADFDWLRKTLLRLNPGHIIPPYEKCIDLPSELNREYQHNRSTLASYFLNSLAQIEIIANSKLFQAFVTWLEYSRFSEFKSIMSKQPTVSTVRQVPSLTSNVPIEITPKNRSINRAIKRYSHEVLSSYQALQNNLNSTIRGTEKLAASVVKMADAVAEIQEQYSNMTNYAPEIKNSFMNEILITINNSFVKWARMLSQQAHIIDSHLSMFVEFSKREHQSVLELLRRRQEAEDEYLKHRLSMQKKKEKSGNDSPDPIRAPAGVSSIPIQKANEFNKDDSPLNLSWKSSSKQVQLRNWSAYLNSSCQKEFSDLYKRKCFDFVEEFRRMCENLITIESSKIVNFNLICGLEHRIQEIKVKHDSQQ